MTSSGLLNAPKDGSCGCYILYREGRCVYVGQSRKLKQRLSRHEVPHDSRKVLYCHKDYLDYLELSLIASLRPTVNKDMRNARIPDIAPEKFFRFVKRQTQAIVDARTDVPRAQRAWEYLHTVEGAWAELIG